MQSSSSRLPRTRRDKQVIQQELDDVFMPRCLLCGGTECLRASDPTEVCMLAFRESPASRLITRSQYADSHFLDTEGLCRRGPRETWWRFVRSEECDPLYGSFNTDDYWWLEEAFSPPHDVLAVTIS